MIHSWSGLKYGLIQNEDEATIQTKVIGDSLGTGTHYLTYTFTSEFNCKRDTTESFVIHPLPYVYITDTMRVKYDKDETSAPLLKAILSVVLSAGKSRRLMQRIMFLIPPWLV